MQNVVIYARYSSSNQTEASIEGQLKVCHEYASRNNYKVVHEYIDRALTGTSDKRPSFQQMIEDSSRKGFDFIIVYQLDRFARNRYDSATYKNRLKKNGVKVLSAKENISDDASGVLMESVLDGMAEYYSAELSQKVKRGMRLNSEKCKYNGGLIPYGFYIDEDKNYCIKEDEAKYVREIFRLLVQKGPHQEIVNYLNSNNAPIQHGRPWTIKNFSRMIRNEKYNGIFKSGDIYMKDGLPKIVDDDLYNQARKLIRLKSERKISFKADTEYLLAGKIYCAECGSHVCGSGAKSKGNGCQYHYYRCLNKVNKHICSLPYFDKDELEKSIALAVKDILTDSFIEKVVDDAINEINNDHDKKIELTNTNKEKSKIKDDIEKFTNLLIQTKNIDIIMDKIDRLKEELVKKENSLYELEKNNITIDRDELIQRIKKIRDYDFDKPDALKLFIDTFIHSVYLNKDKSSRDF